MEKDIKLECWSDIEIRLVVAGLGWVGDRGKDWDLELADVNYHI